jgi:hypothetical protein
VVRHCQPFPGSIGQPAQVISPRAWG